MHLYNLYKLVEPSVGGLQGSFEYDGGIEANSYGEAEKSLMHGKSDGNYMIVRSDHQNLLAVTDGKVSK